MSAPLNTIVSTINTLTAATYSEWVFKCRFELGKELYSVVTDTWVPDKPDLDGKVYDELDRQAMRILVASITQPELGLIQNCSEARQVWKVLEKNFRDRSMLRKCNTMEQIYALRFDHSKTINDHIAAFSKLYQEIKTFEEKLPEAYFVTRFLRSLPEEYTAFARSYDREIETVQLDNVFGQLRSEFYNRVSDTTKQPSAVSANYASNNSSNNQNNKKKSKKGNK